MFAIRSSGRAFFCWLTGLVFCCCAVSGTDDPTREAAGKSTQTSSQNYPISVFYSTGDAIVEYTWMPMDSEATINAAFDILHKRYNCDRLLWRDADIAWTQRFSEVRDDSMSLGKLIKDGIRISNEYHTTEYAERAARARGMQFWGIWPLFDYCGKAECYTGGDENLGSFWGKDPWLAAHPEYCLWDRAHITYITGVVEYGPEVRKEYVRRMDELMRGPLGRFDGLFVYSFVEHFEAHYSDEYIYSDAACGEYKKRYGVDPRTAPFDLEKYYAIRGEFITQYLRELRPLFLKYHKKLAMGLNPFNLEYPQRWIHGEGDILQQGRVKMDWRTWIKEGLVDELHVWGGAEPEQKIKDIKELLEATKGTPIKVSVYFRDEFPDEVSYFYDRGVRRVISTEPRNEEGGTVKRPVSDINSRDADAVLNVLAQARKKEVVVPASKLASLLLNNTNVMVRRQAAYTIETLQLREDIGALEQAAINEPEPSAKAMIFDAIGTVNGPGSVSAMARGFRKVNTWPVRMALRDAISKMGPERFSDVVKAFDTDDTYLRIVMMQGLERNSDKGALYGPLIKNALLHDSEEQVRWWAACALGHGRYADNNNVEALYKAMDDKSDAVQNRAASSLKHMTAFSAISDDLKSRIFEQLIAKYREFGSGCKRSDGDWGWRPIGETIRDGFGDKGKNVLLEILNSGDTQLAQLTWRVFFQPNESTWRPITVADMESRYNFYPGRENRGKCTLADVKAAMKKD